MREGARAHAGDAGRRRSTPPRTRSRRPAARRPRSPAGDTTNEEAFLAPAAVPRGPRLGAPRRRARRARCSPELSRALADPALQATVPDLEFAHAVLVLDCDPVDDAPILDLRIRKGVRRHGVRLARRDRAAVARSTRTPRPCCATRPAAARRCSSRSTRRSAATTATSAARRPRPARTRRRCARSPTGSAGAGEDVVILYGERLLAGPRGDRAAQALLNLATRLGLADHAGAGLLEIPAATNGRGIREAGFAAAHGPGYADVGGRRGRPRARVRRRRRRRRSTCCTPTRSRPSATAPAGRPRCRRRRR